MLLMMGTVCSQTLTQYYTATTTVSGTSPLWIGVNAGHSADPAWTAWLRRLGANGMRVFGLAGVSTTLQSFVTHAGVHWGTDMNNNYINKHKYC